MSKKESLMVHKITLSTGKVVLVREMEMRDEENAAVLATKKSGDSGVGMMYFLINELAKILIVEIDGNKLSGADREQIGKFLKPIEFSQVRKVVSQLMGETTAEPTVEFVSSGQQ